MRVCVSLPTRISKCIAVYYNFIKTSPFHTTLAEITIRVDESDCLSAASCHDMEADRFLSTGTAGRRVSFNEAALFDHGKKAQEKGRRSDAPAHTSTHTPPLPPPPTPKSLAALGPH